MENKNVINTLLVISSIGLAISGIIFLLTLLITYINHSELELSKRIVEAILSGKYDSVDESKFLYVGTLKELSLW